MCFNPDRIAADVAREREEIAQALKQSHALAYLREHLSEDLYRRVEQALHVPAKNDGTFQCLYEGFHEEDVSEQEGRRKAEGRPSIGGWLCD